MRYRVTYQGRVTFPEPVREHQCELRLLPQEREYQRVPEAGIQVEPVTPVFHYLDPFGNRVHHFAAVPPHEHVTVRMDAVVDNRLEDPFAYTPVAPQREAEWIAHSLRDVPRLWDYVLHRSAATPDLSALVARGARSAPEGLSWPAHDPARAVLESVQAAMAWIAERVRLGDGPAVGAKRALAGEDAAPADRAHLLIAIVRSWGVPARYVTGYCAVSRDQETPGPTQTQTQSQGRTPAVPETSPDADAPPADGLLSASDLHPWVEVLVPGAGWLGCDPSLVLVAADAHLPVAVGRDHGDTEPQRGSYQGDGEDAERTVTVTVAPL